MSECNLCYEYPSFQIKSEKKDLKEVVSECNRYQLEDLWDGLFEVFARVMQDYGHESETESSDKEKAVCNGQEKSTSFSYS